MPEFVLVLLLQNPDGMRTSSISRPQSYLVCQMDRRDTRRSLQAAIAEKGVRIVSLECKEVTQK